MPYTKRDFTPVLKGDTYCAPFCGRGCKFSWYEKAMRDSERLCKRLGKGWTPEVWENLGWHFKAISSCGRIKVHCSTYSHPKQNHGKKYTSYIAFFGEVDSPGGYWAEHGDTPEEALKKVMRIAKNEWKRTNKLFKGLFKELDKAV